MKKDIRFFLKLFSATFYLSTFTVGGGYVMIPLMKKKFVDEFQWIENKEMLDLSAIAQAAPGAVAVNAAVIIGFRLAGIPGAIITVAGAVLPPLIILSFASIAYTAFRDSMIVKFILRGMQAGVVAVILDVVITLISDLTKEKRIGPLFIVTGAFAATFFWQVNVIVVILASAVAGIAGSIYIKKGKRGGRKE